MNTVVVFESMFGTTRRVAAAIAEALAPYGPVRCLSVDQDESRAAAATAGLLVIGGPTHVHGMSRPASRIEARNWAKDAAKHVTLESPVPQTGVREFIAGLPTIPAHFAAFDTRVDISHILSGAASASIERALTKRGSRRVSPSASFLVSRGNALEEGEIERAGLWGDQVGAAAVQALV